MPKRSRRTQPAGKSPTPLTTGIGASTYWGALAAIVIVAGAVRVACARGDLWLDEIATLRLLQDITKPSEVFTQLLWDNNHPLNSLFLFFVGPGHESLAYRWLAVVAGMVSVLIAGEVGRRQSTLFDPKTTPAAANLAGLIAAACVACSYLLLHYSSEARGYGPAMCFGLLAILALSRDLARPSGAPLYWIACVLGVLSHVTVMEIMLGGLACSIVFAIRRWRTWPERLAHIAIWHGIPVAAFVLYYVLFVSRVAVGGGPISEVGQVLSDLAAFLLGVPTVAGGIAIAILVLVVLTGLVAISRRNPPIAAFFWVAVIIGPLLSITSEHFILFFVRYFLISAMCALLIVARGLAQLWTSGRRAVSLGLLALFIIGNGVHASRLIRDGRGHYRDALQYVADHTAGTRIAVGGDNDFRNATVVDYYAGAVVGKTIEYVPQTVFLPSGPDWLLLHRLDNVDAPADRLSDGAGHRYLLDRVFPHAALSGWDWYVFHRVN